MAEQHQSPLRQFDHKERKDDVANQIRRQRGVKDGIVFIGVAQEKAQAFQGKKVDGQFQFTRDKTVYVNHYYFRSWRFGFAHWLRAESSSVSRPRGRGAASVAHRGEKRPDLTPTSIQPGLDAYFGRPQ